MKKKASSFLQEKDLESQGLLAKLPFNNKVAPALPEEKKEEEEEDLFNQDSEEEVQIPEDNLPRKPFPSE